MTNMDEELESQVMVVMMGHLSRVMGMPPMKEVEGLMLLGKGKERLSVIGQGALKEGTVMSGTLIEIDLNVNDIVRKKMGIEIIIGPGIGIGTWKITGTRTIHLLVLAASLALFRRMNTGLEPGMQIMVKDAVYHLNDLMPTYAKHN